MKFLLDMPVSHLLLDVLHACGHEDVHAPDSELLNIAHREGRIIITADLDFPKLLALSLSKAPGIILFRGGNYSDTAMCGLLEKDLKRVPAEVMENSICVVDEKRIRMTRLPLDRRP